MSAPGKAQLPKYPAFRELSEPAQAAAGWFRQLARALKTCRLYRPDNPIVQQVRAQLFTQLNQMLERHGAMNFRITTSEIMLLAEPVVRPSHRAGDEDRKSVV